VLFAAALPRLGATATRAAPARAAAASKVRWHATIALFHAQASLPTKAAPPVKRLLESTLARRVARSAPRERYAPNAQSVSAPLKNSSKTPTENSPVAPVENSPGVEDHWAKPT